MEIRENYDLARLNTFGISVQAKYFVEINDESEFQELLSSEEYKKNKKLFLGGGSNILFTKDFDGIVVMNKLKGIKILEDNPEYVLIRSMSGEIWHELVVFAVDRGYWGIENLSFVPGTVGAAPMQNIGAYGVELKNTLQNIEAMDLDKGEIRIFENNECAFGYRDSVFKNKYKDKYFITAITLKLKKDPDPKITYPVLSEFLLKNKIEPTNPKNISEAVIQIRKSKLPDPKIIGNAGSFFKNVFVEENKLKELQKAYPDIPFFKEKSKIKIPAAWLIEQCGWKGYREGNAGVHDKQALVIVNHGGATGGEIVTLTEKIKTSVFDRFGLSLDTEVNFV